jgi:hypothetical protein
MNFISLDVWIWYENIISNVLIGYGFIFELKSHKF